MNQPEVAASNAIANPPQKSGSLELAVREFLAFKLGDEEYGIDILRVQEIRSFERPTRMAIGSLENRMLILLDIEKLMTSAEMGMVAETTH